MSWRSHHEKLQAARDYASSSVGLTRCAHCRTWYYRGSFRDGRVALNAHLERCRKAVAA